MSKIIFVAGLLLFFGNVVLPGQTKYEREYRIKAETVPAIALEFVEQIPFTKKVKWYGEEGLDSRSIEAKSKWEGRRYSIEFDTTGRLEDAEIEIAWDALPEAAGQGIQAYLKENFEKYRIRKIQVQYSGPPEAIFGALTQDYLPEEVTVRYELIVKGKDDAGKEWYEYTFSAGGSFLKRALIVFRNTDHLEF